MGQKDEQQARAQKAWVWDSVCHMPFNVTGRSLNLTLSSLTPAYRRYGIKSNGEKNVQNHVKWYCYFKPESTHLKNGQNDNPSAKSQQEEFPGSEP